MYPTQGILYCAPFTDQMLYMERYKKASFWSQQHFHAVDLSSLQETALEEYFKQPIVDTFDVRILMAKPIGHTVDFTSISESSLHTINIPVTFKLSSSGSIHGIAFWFDVSFIGSQKTIWLTTAPFKPLTHWHQAQCLLKNPLFATAGQEITGHISMKANKKQSYYIDIEIKVVGTSQISCSSYDLKNPYFRSNGTRSNPLEDSDQTNPTESYWKAEDNSTSLYSMAQKMSGPALFPLS